MLTIATWRWGTKYPLEYVERLKAGVKRHLKQDFRFAVFAPEEQDEELKVGCLCRLRLFDPVWQKKHGIEPGDRIVNVDLDLIVTGSLDPVFDRDDPFLILIGANSSNPCPYNGSIFSVIAGYRPDVWTDFTMAKAEAVKTAPFPDDQAWFAHKLPGAKGWKAGAERVYAFGKPGWPKGTALPKDASVVAFPGHRDPSQFQHLDWVREHWG